MRRLVKAVQTLSTIIASDVSDRKAIQVQIK
jgi:hypothetical protein